MRRVVSVLRARRWLLALVAFPCLLLAVAYAVLLPATYQSTVVLAFTPDADAPADETFVRLLPRYSIGATSGASVRAVETELGLPIGTLEHSVRAELLSGSLQLSFTVEGEQAQTVGAATQALADSVVQMTEQDEAVAARILTGPSEPSNTATLRRALAVAIGGVLAVGTGLLVVLAVEGAYPRVRVTDDLLDLGAPILHTMPRRRRPFHAGDRKAQVVMGPHPERLASRLRAVVRHATESTGREARPPVYITSLDDGASYVTPLVEHARRGDGARRGAKLKVASYPPLTDPVADAPSLRDRSYVLVVTGGSRYDLVRETIATGRALGGQLVGFVLVV